MSSNPYTRLHSLLGSTFTGGGPVDGGLGAVTGGGEDDIAISEAGVDAADVARGASAARAVVVPCCGCGATSYPAGLL